MISAIWDPLTRTLAQSINDKDLLDVEFDIEGSALAFAGTARRVPVRYEISTAKTLAGARQLQIVDEEVTPDTPFQEPDSSVTLTARAILVGLDRDPSEIDWTVDLLDPQGTVAIEDLNVGAGTDVSAVWNGKIGGVAVEDPALYVFEIKAQVGCDDGPPILMRALASTGQGCAQDDLQVAITPKPELVWVRLDDRLAGYDETTSSKPLSGDDLNPVQILQDQKLKIRKLAESIVPDSVGRINVSFDLGKSSNPNVISGQGPVTFPLVYNGSEETEPYTFAGYVTPRFFKEHSDGNQVKRGFTVVDASNEDFFHSTLIQGFLSERNVLLGRSEMGADSDKINSVNFPPSDEDDVIETSKEAFQTAGYETVEFRADDPVIPKLAAFKLKIRFRLENQAPLLFYRGSIKLPENALSLGSEEILPRDGYFDTFAGWKQVRTVILTGCGALNLGNLGSTEIGKYSVEAANAGRPWAYAMFPHGVERILGYNRRPPKDSGQFDLESRCMKSFLYLFDTRFYRDNSAGIDEAALAWVYGHANTSVFGTSAERVVSAVAFTRQGYLFVFRAGGDRERTKPGLHRKLPSRKTAILFVPTYLWENVGLQIVPNTPSPTVAQVLTTPFRPAVVNLDNVYTHPGVRRIDVL